MLRLVVVVVGVMLASGLAWGQGASGGSGGGDSGRVVRFFDFDERRMGNREELPMMWVKKQGPGLPHYVNGRIVQGVGRSSNYSFRFDLNGGSLVYVYAPPAGVGGEDMELPGPIPVRHGAIYRVEVFVKTTALENARARLTAYFVDRDNQVLERSVTHSAAYRGKGLGDEWYPLTVDLRADDRKAAYLVIELGLLQPSLYAPNNLGPRTLFNQDVSGSAWFTDLSVSQVPEVALKSDAPGNIFPRGTPVRLGMRITDREASDLTMRLEVVDAEGKLVFQRSGELQAAADAEGLEHEQVVEIPELPTGWYEARIVLTARGREVARQVQGFVQLPDAGRLVQPDARFGVIATDWRPAEWAALPKILPLIGAGRVKLAVWGEHTDIQTQDQERFDLLLERLQDSGIMPTAVITALPPEVAAAAGSSALSRLPRMDSALWKPQLAYLVARHANHLDRWQFGADGRDDFATDALHRRAYDMVYAAFASLIHDPDVAMPWPATFEADRGLPATVAVGLPAEVLPEQVGMFVQDTRDRGGQRLSMTLFALDEHQGRVAVLRDYFQRIVMAAAAGTERIDLPMPFEGGQPTEMLLVMRTVQQSLSGTAYRGRLNVHDMAEAHLFEHNGRGVMALWNKSKDGASLPVRINLGGRPTMVDVWGNRTPLRPAVNASEPGQIHLTLGEMPVFIDGVDPSVALFRVSVVLDNPMLESQFQPHTRKLNFTNTFPDFVSGTVRLAVPAGWSVTPTSFTFNLNPGETFSREIQLELPYNTLAGAKVMEATFEMAGIVPARFAVPVDLMLGLNEVGLQTIAMREGSDVVVQVLITNYGQRNINYNAFALFPGQARQERLVTDLGPGRTAVRRFRFPAPELPANSQRKIRVGLREVEGTRILNDEVVIP